jgi:hypothetical protein
VSAAASRRVDWEERARYWHALALGAMPELKADVLDYPRRCNPSRARLTPDEVKRALASYRVTHWGEPGNQQVIETRTADPTTLLTKLGDLFSVTYLTSKRGDPKRSLYEHEFKVPLPALAYSRSGLLAICGGAYRVNWRGIVG